MKEFIYIEGFNLYYDMYYVFKNILMDLLEWIVMVFIGLLGCGKFMLFCMLNWMNDMILGVCVEG